jgi:chromate transporter
MQRDLLENRRWITKQDYVEELALAQLAPGPLAGQLAIYLGWVRAGTLGATLVSTAFILPSFLLVLVLSALYVRYGGLCPGQARDHRLPTVLIALATLGVLSKVRKVSEPLVILTAGAVGLLVQWG